MNRKHFNIYKAHGGKEKFSGRKLFASLKRSGLPYKQCQLITDKVSKEINEGSDTKEIFKKTLRLVKQNSHVAAVHYSLKRAIFELGPTGHQFELFVAKYFQHKGFNTKTCQTLNGRLVKHEVDVIGMNNNTRIFAECKFHNRLGIKNDIKIALYIKARRDDLKEGPEGKNFHHFYLVSNTAFSKDAITYSAGSDIVLLGVNAPSDRSFLDEIKDLNLYPVTSLRGLSKLQKNELLIKNIILAKELPRHINFLLKIGMLDHEIDKLLGEIKMLETY